MDANATGQFIAERRKEKGYTQKELADKLMVTDKAISRWETGKGLPDTSLLKPLGDILGVSVGELLAGRVIEEAQMKEQTDDILLETLNYSKRMLIRVINIVLYIAGGILILSPLYYAGSNSYLFPAGIFLLIIAAAFTLMRKTGFPMKRSEKAYSLAAMALQAIALVLEIMPCSVVMVFADGPNRKVLQLYSHFSLLPVGYAMFSPIVTGILTIAILLLGIIALFSLSKAPKCRNGAFICSILALLFSLVPLLMFGSLGMNAAGYSISGLLALSICLQAVANRKC